MRVAWLLGWILYELLPLAAARELPKRPPTFVSAGQPYLQLEHWANANHFDFSLNKKEDEIHLTNGSSKLVLKPNSLRAEIDGVLLYLAYPVLVRPEGTFIAEDDLELSVSPLLIPAKSKPRRLVKTVAISAGHGGKDPGNHIGSALEKTYTLLLAREVERLVARAGLKPVMIRSTDTLVDLEEKARLARRSKADVLLELHYNSAGAVNDARGVEVYCLTPSGAHSTNGGRNHYGDDLPGNKHDERNILLAFEVQRALVHGARLTDRGVRRARFVVLREAEMPAVLIEAGFMSDPGELRSIRDPNDRRRTAQAILDGVLAYKRLIER